MAYFNQIWDSGYHYVEPFETNPENQILAKFGQNDGLIWPNFGQIFKNVKMLLFCIRKWYFQNFTHFEAPHWNLERSPFGQIAKWPNLGQKVPNLKNDTFWHKIGGKWPFSIFGQNLTKLGQHFGQIWPKSDFWDWFQKVPHNDDQNLKFGWNTKHG